MTITPEASAGERVWEPSEFRLTAKKITRLEDLDECGMAWTVEIWNGTAFGPDDPGKYAGEQRLKIIFQVEPGTTKTWLQYYTESLGELVLPAWTVSAPA
jgi:hypothetical protein